jgi:hypothetical protein
MKRSLIAVALVLCCLGANTKPMSNMVALVGTWSCMTTTAAGNKDSTAIYRTIAGTDALEFSVRSPGYTASGYMGYDEVVGQFFIVTADAYDGVSRSTGSIQPSGMLSMTGTASYGGVSSPIRETIGLVEPNQLHDRTEMLKGGTWTLLDNAICVRK